MSRPSLSIVFATGAAILLLSGCATSSRIQGSAADTMEAICGPARGSGTLEGAVWLKAKSKEASGQFPADVAVERDRLILEVTNLIGETQARIRVEGDRYQIDVPGKETLNQSGQSVWGGIPLRWAQRLFLGGVPCPPMPLPSGAKATLEVDRQLFVEAPADGGTEEFIYVLTDWAGKPWVRELTWLLRDGAKPMARVQFVFERPDENTGAPLRWSAVSDHGSVDVRWRRRKPSAEKRE